MTSTLQVRTKSRSYPVVIGEGLLPHTADLLKEQGISAEQIALITDEHINQFNYAEQIAQSFAACGVQLHALPIGAGDAHKTLATAEYLYHQLLQVQFRRSGLILALGGGVVGDVAGFVAATYQRGVRYVQIPTTLLAHDSSIGGKVGVNLNEAKNLVGAFHQPEAVILDIQTFRSLPAREWRGGMAEVIKHGIISNPGLFHRLLATPCVEVPSPSIAEQMLVEAMQVKIDIIQADEFDTGERMKLNVGHTIGHAVEQASGYHLNHGEAVSIGICMESDMAVRKGWLSKEVRDQINYTFQQHGLPTHPPEIPLEDVLTILRLDKKHSAAGWTFAVPFAIGDVRIVHDITEEDVAYVWTH